MMEVVEFGQGKGVRGRVEGSVIAGAMVLVVAAKNLVVCWVPRGETARGKNFFQFEF